MTHGTGEPMEPARYDAQNRRLCTAHRTNGQPCSAPSMTGQATCRKHGAGAPQNRRAAARRLAVLGDEALDTLAAVLHNPDAPDRDKLRAADSVLDRAGYPRGAKVETNDAHHQLIERLLELRDAEEET